MTETCSCRRCGARKSIPDGAVRFTHWFCHRTDAGAKCWTFNVLPSLMIAVLLGGCSEEDPVSVSRTDNPAFNVGLLFEHDGCRVYRFRDGHHYIYFARCVDGQVRTTWDETRRHGKTSSSRPVSVETGR